MLKCKKTKLQLPEVFL